MSGFQGGHLGFNQVAAVGMAKVGCVLGVLIRDQVHCNIEQNIGYYRLLSYVFRGEREGP